MILRYLLRGTKLKDKRLKNLGQGASFVCHHQSRGVVVVYSLWSVRCPDDSQLEGQSGQTTYLIEFTKIDGPY